jgi:hypothetical protein
VGRVLERINQRLEQKHHQQMCQHIGSGRSFIGSWRSLQPDETFQSLEAKLDPPAQAIEGKHVRGREFLGFERRSPRSASRRR